MSDVLTPKEKAKIWRENLNNGYGSEEVVLRFPIERTRRSQELKIQEELDILVDELEVLDRKIEKLTEKNSKLKKASVEQRMIRAAQLEEIQFVRSQKIQQISEVTTQLDKILEESNG